MQHRQIKLVYTKMDDMWLHAGDISDKMKRNQMFNAGASADYV